MRVGSFNPSRGIAIIQTDELRDARSGQAGFNPSRGIAIIQTVPPPPIYGGPESFNPSRGIAIIQTVRRAALAAARRVSIPHAG